jgi:hypothetical protein
MKACTWCDREMKRQNLSKHQSSCTYKKMGLSKSEIERLKGMKEDEGDKDNDQIEIDNVELKQFLLEIYKRSRKLHHKIVDEDPRAPEDRINDLNVSQATKNNYLREWVLYNKWQKRSKKPLGKESAETYLGSLTCKASTKKQKYNTIQLLLQHIIDPSIRLDKVRWRISVRPKYALSPKELRSYLREQQLINREDHLMQRFMATYGLRINTCASLRLKHLEYRLRDEDDEDKRIHLPDSKTKSYRIESIDKELIRLFECHIRKTIKDEDDGESFVFAQESRELEERARAWILSKRITKRINDSRVLKKYPGYTYSSHMFRKTKAYTMYQSGVSALKEMVRKSIGQQSGSGAVESYIH